MLVGKQSQSQITTDFTKANIQAEFYMHHYIYEKKRSLLKKIPNITFDLKENAFVSSEDEEL